MLKIRPGQMRVLGAPFLEEFVRRAALHVAAHFRDQHDLLGEGAVREAVLHAILRAEAHGLTRDEDVLAYLSMMFVFGRDFDQDPTSTWAAEALGSRRSAELRMARLQELALAHERSGRGYLARKGDARA
jgi:hypothetical protein